MEQNKYHFARELIFELRANRAISEKVYLHYVDKLIADEKLASDGDLSGVSNSVCPNCGKRGYKTDLTDNSYACKKCLTWWANGC